MEPKTTLKPLRKLPVSTVDADAVAAAKMMWNSFDLAITAYGVIQKGSFATVIHVRPTNLG